MNNWDLFRYSHGGGGGSTETEKYRQQSALYESVLTGTVTEFDVPSNWTTLRVGVFYGCVDLTTVTVPESVTSIGSGAFSGCSTLTALILKSETVCSLGATSAFNNSPIAFGTGFIYVPNALVEEYKVATNWATFADQFRAIEDYPDITGG